MPLGEVEHARVKKSRNQSESASHLERRDAIQYKQSSKSANRNGSSETNKSFSKKPEKKKIFVSLTFGGLGCRRIKSPVSAPAVIRSAAQWENKQPRKRGHRSKTRSNGAKNPANVVVDVPDVCCTPPGIGSASDVAARPRINAQSTNQHSRLVRRTATTEDVSASDAVSFQANMPVNRQLHRSHHSRGTPKIVMFHNHPFYRGISDVDDRYGDWRLDVDSMSYEQLLDLGDRIGYACTGLQEEEILHSLTRSKHSVHDSLPMLVRTEKDFRCSICQEGWTADNDAGRLDCGHLYHTDCIKQWLLQKNTCPVCKNAAISERWLKD